MWTRAELKSRAKIAFKNNYWRSVVAGVVMVAGLIGSQSFGGNACTSVVSMIAGGGDDWRYIIRNTDPSSMALICGIMVTILAVFGLAQVFIFNPLAVGASRFFLRNSRQADARLGEVADGFRYNYFGVVGTLFLRDVFLFFWWMLFLIPGFVKFYSYMMVPFILADHPEISGTDAITLSRRMMDGEKWKAFVLGLSFLGWTILSVMTCMLVGVLWTIPYVYATNAELYQTLKHKIPELA